MLFLHVQFDLGLVVGQGRLTIRKEKCASIVLIAFVQTCGVYNSEKRIMCALIVPYASIVVPARECCKYKTTLVGKMLFYTYRTVIWNGECLGLPMINRNHICSAPP